MKALSVQLWLIAFLLLSVTAKAATTQTADRQVRAELNNYLWDAARRGDNTLIKTLVEAKYNLNAADEKGYTAIILAAYHGHDDTVKMLIDGGADPCQRDRRGNSALMGAIFKGELKVARRLIDAHCQPDMRNNAGQTAAMYASLFQRQSLLQALREKGADMHAVDAKGNSADSLASGRINGIP
ncbi:ankyrin repeat domain-containing protein [Erwinia tasmaniensis]|uniref:ankyrin repeat domain-containing protein n=1 Tax=Erwinia tasmaniensis TaxID=338565 RepID=UPI003A4D4EC1